MLKCTVNVDDHVQKLAKSNLPLKETTASHCCISFIALHLNEQKKAESVRNK